MLVDVLVPAFGDDALVRQSIISVRGQTEDNWRLTLVDDGPAAGRDPGLGAWVRRLDDSRIRYLANPEQLGINRNFQRCVELSEGELVVLLGADDRLLPDFVARVRRIAAAMPHVAFIHTGARVIGPDGAPSRPVVDRVKAVTSIRAPKDTGVRTVGGERLAASLLRGNWMYFPSVAFRRTWLVEHGFRPGYQVVQDLDLYLRMLRAGGRAALLAQPGIEYRRHPSSVSSELAEDGSRFDEERRFFAETAAELAASGWPVAARAARWHLTSRLHALVRTPGLLCAGQTDGAVRLLRGALAPLPARPVESSRGGDAASSSDTRPEDSVLPTELTRSVQPPPNDLISNGPAARAHLGQQATPAATAVVKPAGTAIAQPGPVASAEGGRRR